MKLPTKTLTSPQRILISILLFVVFFFVYNSLGSLSTPLKTTLISFVSISLITVYNFFRITPLKKGSSIKVDEQLLLSLLILIPNFYLVADVGDLSALRISLLVVILSAWAIPTKVNSLIKARE
jgi:signal transduction histidine kinase